MVRLPLSEISFLRTAAHVQLSFWLHFLISKGTSANAGFHCRVAIIGKDPQYFQALPRRMFACADA